MHTFLHRDCILRMHLGQHPHPESGQGQGRTVSWWIQCLGWEGREGGIIVLIHWDSSSFILRVVLLISILKMTTYCSFTYSSPDPHEVTQKMSNSLQRESPCWESLTFSRKLQVSDFLWSFLSQKPPLQKRDEYSLPLQLQISAWCIRVSTHATHTPNWILAHQSLLKSLLQKLS